MRSTSFGFTGDLVDGDDMSLFVEKVLGRLGGKGGGSSDEQLPASDGKKILESCPSIREHESSIVSYHHKQEQQK